MQVNGLGRVESATAECGRARVVRAAALAEDRGGGSHSRSPIAILSAAERPYWFREKFASLPLTTQNVPRIGGARTRWEPGRLGGRCWTRTVAR